MLPMDINKSEWLVLHGLISIWCMHASDQARCMTWHHTVVQAECRQRIHRDMLEQKRWWPYLVPPPMRASCCAPIWRVKAPRTYTPGLAGQCGTTSASNREHVPGSCTSGTAGGISTLESPAADAPAPAPGPVTAAIVSYTSFRIIAERPWPHPANPRPYQQ
jgi:hypothetical protein